MATKKSDGAVIITLPEIEFKTVTVKIKGITPLVTQPMTIKNMRKIEDKQHGAAKTKKNEIRNEWEDFIQSIYWLSTPPEEYTEKAFVKAVQSGAHYGFSVGGVKDSAVTAAVRRGVVKNAPVGRGLFQIINAKADKLYDKQCVEIITPEPPKMRVDCLSTFSSGADMRYRPQFDEWRMEFDVKFDAGILSLDQLLMWFKLGGFACGLGENRAEKGEGWGSYELDM